MSSLSVDCKFPRHPKVAPLSDAAFRLHLHALAHCAEHETDGFVGERVLDGLSKHRGKIKLVTELMGAKTRPDGNPLWKPVAGGWIIHDYLQWNESHEDLDAKREAAKVRQKEHRAPKVRANRAQTEGELFEHFADSASSVREVSGAGARAISPLGVSGSGSESAMDLFESLADPDRDSHRARGGNRATSLPADWAPTDKDREFAATRGWDSDRVADEALHFANHHRAKGTTSKSWQASWITWVMQGRRFERQSGGRRPGPARAVQPAATTEFKPGRVLE